MRRAVIQQIPLVNLIKISFNLNIILCHSKFTLISDYNSAAFLHSHDISYLIINMYFLWIVCTFYGIVLIYAIYIWPFFICKYVTYHKYYIPFLYIISKKYIYIMRSTMYIKIKLKIYDTNNCSHSFRMTKI